MASQKIENPIVSIALSKYLLFVLSATLIWGLFPLPFYFMEGIESNFPAAYLLLRYLTASVFFLVILFALFSKTLGSVRPFIKAHWKVLLYGGTTLFLARMFEVWAFKAGQRTFALIFCVALVPLTEPVAVYLFYRRRVFSPLFRFIFGPDEAAKMRSVINEKENYWVGYLLTFALIFSSAMFFIYGRDGQIILSSAGGSRGIYVYLEILASALALQLCFHTYDFGFTGQEAHFPSDPGDSHDKCAVFLTRVKPVVLKQTAFAVVAAFWCVIWNFSAETTLWNAIRSVEHPARFWTALILGIVIFGTIIAYIFENFGLDNYDMEKNRLPFRIRGVEWGGILTFTDPLAANALTACFPFLISKPAAHPHFFFLSLGMILLLILLKILMLHHSKFQAFRIFCFSHLRSRRTSGERIEPDHFSSVALIRNLKRIREKEFEFEIIEACKVRKGDVPENKLHEHLQHQLWLFNSNHLEMRQEIAVWVMKHGKLICHSRQLFERLLFHEFMRYFCTENSIREGRIQLFFPDKLKFDEDRLIQLVKTCTPAPLGEDDQIFYFLDIPEYEDISGKIKAFIKACLEIFSDRNRFSRTQKKVMMDVLCQGYPD